MPPKLRTAPGMREKSPGKWELIVEAGRDPVTGRKRQVSRMFHGTLSEAKNARAALLVEVGKGAHAGTGVTVDQLFRDWIKELERKGRSPNTISGYTKHYTHDIKPTLGKVPVRKVTTKMLSDLYGKHQDRGLKPTTVYQIHACLSSMLTQACRWGWRDSNPAQWAAPPSIPNVPPVVPAPEEVMALIAEAERSRRPEKARAIFVAATTGMRRAEICAVRRDRDIDWERGRILVRSSIVQLPGKPLFEKETKNRRSRPVALDDFTMSMLKAQIDFVTERAKAAEVQLDDDPYVFTDDVDGSEPWGPNTITQYFKRLRERCGLDHLDFHYLRKFMETYGQDLGFSPVQVAMRAGHDPSIAAKHYTGSIEETDRALSEALAGLLVAKPVDGVIPPKVG